MGADAESILNEKINCCAIPSDAYVRREKNVVWGVDSEGKARRKEVEVGVENDEEAEIVSGLEEGTEIITKGITGLKEGQKIR